MESEVKNLPGVALESTVIAHGLPIPDNIRLAAELEAIVIDEGATPYTIGIIKGVMRIGMTPEEIERLATTDDVRKVSLRDLSIVTARRLYGATTVASTMWIAHRHGLKVFATGGIGGVHRSLSAGAVSPDVSADMEALASIPMVVVCAGPKSILDLRATRELLETKGVTVIGYQTDEMPAFYSRTSGLPVDVRCDTYEEIADIVLAGRRLGLKTATLVTAPIEASEEIPADVLEPLIESAVEEADHRQLQAAQLTPFLLKQIRHLTKNHSLSANQALLKSNARIAANLARILFNETT